MFFPALALAAATLAQEPFDSDDPLDAHPVTGIEVGERIPDFHVKDLEGKVWDFESIKGPKGALLHFYRFADW